MIIEDQYSYSLNRLDINKASSTEGGAGQDGCAERSCRP